MLLGPIQARPRQTILRDFRARGVLLSLLLAVPTPWNRVYLEDNKVFLFSLLIHTPDFSGMVADCR